MQRGRTENRSEFKHLSETSKVKADNQYVYYSHLEKTMTVQGPKCIQFEQRDKLTIPLLQES